MDKRIILERGKDKPVRNRHPWIFSGAIKKWPKGFEDGEVLEVFDFHGGFLGKGYFHQGTSLSGRMITFDKTPIDQAIGEHIKSAIALRKVLFNPESTNSYRLINGEGDNMPGLIVDYYNGLCVLQVSTRGMDKLKPIVVKHLQAQLNPTGIMEKSKMAARRKEKLEDRVVTLAGKVPERIEVLENGVKFEIDPINSHKTGFYLDQREMRQLVGKLVAGKKLLNCFSYTGGFSVFGAVNGAETISVDISQEVMDQAKRNFDLNGINSDKHEFVAQDVFDYLNAREQLDADFVILDPPAFAKKKKDIPSASSGYRKLNKLAIEKAKPGSFLLTCSCSYHIDHQLFQKLIFQAALDSKRKIRIISRHVHAPDHALNLYAPEQDYLKSLLLWVE